DSPRASWSCPQSGRSLTALPGGSQCPSWEMRWRILDRVWFGEEPCGQRRAHSPCGRRRIAANRGGPAASDVSERAHRLTGGGNCVAAAPRAWQSPQLTTSRLNGTQQGAELRIRGRRPGHRLAPVSIAPSDRVETYERVS